MFQQRVFGRWKRGGMYLTSEIVSADMGTHQKLPRKLSKFDQITPSRCFRRRREGGRERERRHRKARDVVAQKDQLSCFFWQNCNLSLMMDIERYRKANKPPLSLVNSPGHCDSPPPPPRASRFVLYPFACHVRTTRMPCNSL